MTTCDITYVLTTSPALDHLPRNFHPGYRVKRPDQMGFYMESGAHNSAGWYFYEIDDHNCCTLCGPFDDRAIVYVCALKLHCSASFSQWKFTEKDRRTYLHTHLHTL